MALAAYMAAAIACELFVITDPFVFSAITVMFWFAFTGFSLTLGFGAFYAMRWLCIRGGRTEWSYRQPTIIYFLKYNPNDYNRSFDFIPSDWLCLWGCNPLPVPDSDGEECAIALLLGAMCVILVVPVTLALILCKIVYMRVRVTYKNSQVWVTRISDRRALEPGCHRDSGNRGEGVRKGAINA